MKDNPFFKPTPLYKEFMILDMVHKNEKITQRAIADALSISVSMVNGYLDAYEEDKLLKRTYLSSKTVRYKLRPKGIERMKVLNISFLNATQKVYRLARENIVSVLKQLENDGLRRIVLYGAGEVAEILIQAMRDEPELKTIIVGVVDDDPNKQGKSFYDVTINSSGMLTKVEHDGVLVASYRHNEAIYNKLIKQSYPKHQIIRYFDI